MKLIINAFFVLLAFTVGVYSQTTEKDDAALNTAMKSFINSIETKNTAVFLSFVSPTKGLTIMNTIDQGETGNADKPVFDSKLTVKKLAADFKKKGANYQDIFVPSEFDPNFHDVFAGRKEKWKLGADNKFMFIDEETGEASNQAYVKWEKENGRWYAVEVGRMIS